MIAATLSGFDSADAAIVLKKGGGESAYERVAMLKGENGTYEGLLFDLDDPSSTSSKPRACAHRRSRSRWSSFRT